MSPDKTPPRLTEGPDTESFTAAQIGRDLGVHEAVLRGWLREGVVTATADPRPGSSRRRFSVKERAAVALVAAAKQLGIQPHKMAHATSWVLSQPLPRGFVGWVVLGTDGQVLDALEELDGQLEDPAILARRLAKLPDPGLCLVRLQIPPTPTVDPPGGGNTS